MNYKPIEAELVTLEELFRHLPFTPRPKFYAQPKIFGVRGCWEPEEQKLYTRQGNKINSLPHLTSGLCRSNLSQYPLEGEIYSEIMDFEDLQGLIRQGINKDENHFVSRLIRGQIESLKLYVFDIRLPSLNLKKRMKLLNTLKESEHIIRIESQLIETEEDALDFYAWCLDQGFEGTVFRKAGSKYDSHLYKMKPTQKLKCIYRGFHKADSLILELPSGQQFYCAGLSEKSKNTIASEYMRGSYIPVLHEGYTRNGVPQFARVDNERV